MQTTCQELCILSSCCLLLAACGDRRELLGPTSPDALIAVPEGDVTDDIPPEYQESPNLFLTSIIAITDTEGSMWGLVSATSNRLYLQTKVDLEGTSQGHGEMTIAKSYFLPIHHSLNGTARAGTQNVCGGVANGTAYGRAYNEAPTGRSSWTIFSNEEKTHSKTAAQPVCVDSPSEGGTVQPVGGGGGGTSGDDGDCTLWGKWVDGILVYTWFVGADC